MDEFWVEGGVHLGSVDAVLGGRRGGGGGGGQGGRGGRVGGVRQVAGARRLRGWRRANWDLLKWGGSLLHRGLRTEYIYRLFIRIITQTIFITVVNMISSSIRITWQTETECLRARGRTPRGQLTSWSTATEIIDLNSQTTSIDGNITLKSQNLNLILKNEKRNNCWFFQYQPKLEKKKPSTK